MIKIILIVIIVAIVWAIWYFFGHVLFGLDGVLHSWGLWIISGVIIGFIAAPYSDGKKKP